MNSLRRAREWLGRWVWIISAALLAASAMWLGFNGVTQLLPGSPHSARALHTIELFTLNGPSRSDGGTEPLALVIGRILPPLSLAIFGLRLTAPLYRRRLRLFRTTLPWRRHTVICGLSDSGTRIAAALLRTHKYGSRIRRRRHSVVVIDPDPDEARRRIVEQSGGSVLEGDASDPSALRRARSSNAGDVFITVDDDGLARRIRDAVIGLGSPGQRESSAVIRMHVRDPWARRHLQLQAIKSPHQDFELEYFGVHEHAYDELFTNASDMAAVFERYDSAHDRPVVVMGDGRQALDCLRSLVGRTQATLDVRLDGLGSPILPRTFAGRSHTIVIAGPDSATIREEGRLAIPTAVRESFTLLAHEHSGTALGARNYITGGFAELPAHPRWVFVASERSDNLFLADHIRELLPDDVHLAVAVDGEPHLMGSRSFAREGPPLWQTESPVTLYFDEYEGLLDDPSGDDRGRLGLIDDLAQARHRSLNNDGRSWRDLEVKDRRECRQFMLSLCRQMIDRGWTMTLAAYDRAPSAASISSDGSPSSIGPNDAPDSITRSSPLPDWKSAAVEQADEDLRHWSHQWWGDRTALTGVNSNCHWGGDGLGSAGEGQPSYINWFHSNLLVANPPNAHARSR